MSRAPHNDPADPISLARLGPAPVGSVRFSRAAIASLLVHLTFVAIFFAMPETGFHSYPTSRMDFDVRQAVKLVAPRLPQQLTQKDPNQGKVRNELDAFSSVKAKPAPRVFQPPAAPSGPAVAPAPQAITAPKIEVNVEVPQTAGVPGVPVSSQPPAPAPPKLEDIAPPRPIGTPNPGFLKAPPGDIAKAIPKAGGSGGGMVSDGDNGSTSSLEGMQLLSDPKNVDFRPYMQLVANQVRQQWLRMGPTIGGTRITIIQVNIDRQGRIPKMVISRNSGAVVFDQAAIASLSSAVPFPPLPGEFTGTEIQIQLTFTNFRRVP